MAAVFEWVNHHLYRPLLDHSSSNVDVTSKTTYQELELPFHQQFLIESKKLWHIVGPAIFSRIATYCMFIITQAFAGHLGDLELAAISIATNVIVGFDFGLLLGMASALETLCGQGTEPKTIECWGCIYNAHGRAFRMLYTTFTLIHIRHTGAETAWTTRRHSGALRRGVNESDTRSFQPMLSVAVAKVSSKST